MIERSFHFKPHNVGRWVVWSGYALVLLLAPLVFSSSLSQTLLSQMGIAIIACLAYNMLLGQGGMLSFGHAVYSGLGGFLAIHALNKVGNGTLHLPVSLVPLAGLAGVIGGTTFITEPAMAASVGSILFVVVVVGGTGSLVGAFVGSLLIGLLQTVPLTVDKSLVDAASTIGWTVSADSAAYPLMKLTLAQVAPILPYLLLVLVLIVRPRGLFGTRDD